MPLNPMEIYSCIVCGNTLTGFEWGEHLDKSFNGKDYCCPGCGAGLNEDELKGEEN